MVDITLQDDQLDSILHTAIEIVKQAGKTHFSDRSFSFSQKNQTLTDFVTNKDIAVEKEISSKLSACFPQFNFLGEEGTLKTENISPHDHEVVPVCKPDQSYYWILDPIDGTTNFLHGLDLCCISLALVKISGNIEANSESIIGIIYQPMVDMLYYGIKGKGAYRCDSKGSLKSLPLTKHSEKKGLKDSLVLTEWHFPLIETIDGYYNWVTGAMQKMVNIPVHGIRSLGSAALNLVRVAEGGADLYFEMGIHVWDMAAGVLIVQEAGGSFANIANGPFSMTKRSVIGAISQKIMDEFKEVIRDPPLAKQIENILPQLQIDQFNK